MKKILTVLISALTLSPLWSHADMLIGKNPPIPAIVAPKTLVRTSVLPKISPEVIPAPKVVFTQDSDQDAINVLAIINRTAFIKSNSDAVKWVSDIKETLNLANKYWMIPKTGVQFRLQTVLAITGDAKGYDLYNYKEYLHEYLEETKNIPQFIIGFLNNPTAISYGGGLSGLPYGLTSDLALQVCNRFDPITAESKDNFAEFYSDMEGFSEIEDKIGVPNSIIPTAMIDMSSELLASTQPGTMLSTIKYLSPAYIIVHEFLHAYGSKIPGTGGDHWCVSGLNIPNFIQEPINEILEDTNPTMARMYEYAMICPTVWNRFKEIIKDCP